MKKYAFLLLLIAGSCEKSSFLQKSPSENFVQPATLDQCLALLNNPDLMGPSPVYGEQSSDDYLLQATRYNILSNVDKNIYTWQKDIYQGAGNIPDWNISYQQLYIVNTVLKTLSSIAPDTDSTRQLKNQVRAIGLFIRSYVFHNLAQVFAPVYRNGEAAIQKGIVLPTELDFDPVGRATLEATYEKIIADLLEAIPLLPADRPGDYRNLPYRASGFALLARVYISMRAYDKALPWADSCLHQQAALMDYNQYININMGKNVFPALNEEVLYRSWLIEGNVIRTGAYKDCIIAPELYALYDNNDLRKRLFFDLNDSGKPWYKNAYTGNVYAFSGLAVDEMYLVRAECRARAGKVTAAMADVDALLGKRYLTGTYRPRVASDAASALTIIADERRKELVFRGLRWQDLRRRNEEGAGIKLERYGGNQLYQLLPKSVNYVLPIPDDARTGRAFEQNDRE